MGPTPPTIAARASSQDAVAPRPRTQRRAPVMRKDLKRGGKPWSTAENAYLWAHKGAESGDAPHQYIADHLGRSGQACRIQLMKLRGVRGASPISPPVAPPPAPPPAPSLAPPMGPGNRAIVHIAPAPARAPSLVQAPAATMVAPVAQMCSHSPDMHEVAGIMQSMAYGPQTPGRRLDTPQLSAQWPHGQMYQTHHTHAGFASTHYAPAQYAGYEYGQPSQPGYLHQHRSYTAPTSYSDTGYSYGVQSFPPPRQE